MGNKHSEKSKVLPVLHVDQNDNTLLEQDALNNIFKMLEIQNTFFLLEKQEIAKLSEKDKNLVQFQVKFLLKEIPMYANFHINEFLTHSIPVDKLFQARYSIKEILDRTPLNHFCKIQFTPKQAEIYHQLYSFLPKWSQERIPAELFCPSDINLYKCLRAYSHLHENLCFIVLEFFC